MAARRTERLLNLVICLLNTRAHLTADRIRELVPGYAEAASEDAFKRMFERDKEELRDLGIPLEVGRDSWSDEDGYRIARRDYELPEISLEPDEAAAVGLAARMWRSATLSEAASMGLLKLQAAGIRTDGPLPAGFEPHVEAGEAAFDPLVDAVRDGRAVEFDYRGAAEEAPHRRHVEPWGVVSWHGRWYTVGHDRDRDATRVFRLSRVVGDVTATGPAHAVQPPADADLRGHVAAYAALTPAARARLRVRADRAADLRREALKETKGDDGWDVVEVGFADIDRLVDRVVGYAADVVVESPPEAREAIVTRLRRLLEVTA